MNSKKEPTKEDLEKEIEILKLKIRIAELEKELAEKQAIRYDPIIIDNLPKMPESPWYHDLYRPTCFDVSFKEIIKGEGGNGS